MAQLPARIEEKFIPEPNTSCWLWTAARQSKGYGAVGVRGRGRRLAHRVVYELLVGPIPPGLQLDHVKARGCCGPECVNPDHLEPVTNRINLLRGDTFTAANAAKTHCPQGHDYNPDNTYVDPQGRRECRRCTRAARVRERERRRASRTSDDRVACACGCGETLFRFDDRGRARRWSRGHNARGAA